MIMKHFQTGLSGAPEDKGANLPHLYSNLPFPTVMPPNRYHSAAATVPRSHMEGGELV